MFGLKLYLMGSVLTCFLTALFLRGAGRDPFECVETSACSTSTAAATTASPMASSCAPAASTAN